MSYPPPPGGYPPPGYPPPPPQHPSAITALVFAILGFACCGVFGIPAFVLGRQVEAEVRASGGTLSGEGLGRAAWILGLISMVLAVFALIGLLLYLAFFGVVAFQLGAGG